MKPSLRVLHVEDSESDAHLIARHITKAGIDGSICRVETEDQLVDALLQNKPSVILSDFSLPQLCGLRALELSLTHAPDVPFIYISGTIGEERAVDALRRGATDYILKSNLSRLASSIERALRESSLKTEKHKSEQVRREQGIRLQRLTRTYQTLSSTSSAIVRLRSSTELMDEVCRIAVEQGGYDYVSISVFESEGQLRTPHAVAKVLTDCDGDDPKNIAHLDMARLITQRAIRTGAPSLLNDDLLEAESSQFPSNPRYPEAAAMPLIVDGTAIGALAFLSTTRNIFDAAEIKVLLELTANLGFALQYLAKDETVHFLSYFDSLTGLAKRPLFCQRIASRLGADDTECARTVIVFDVQKLGTINDSLGRYVGDRLLEQIAARLKQAYKDAENIAYFGGGTFAITSQSEESDSQTGWFLRHAAQVFTEPFSLEGDSIKVSVRAGSACYPQDGESAEKLVQNAEAALNCAREENEKYKLYGLITNAPGAHLLALETRLSDALARNEFRLHYQPKINIATGALEGFEALLRWQDPVEGLVSPVTFIPLLERSGAIIEVGVWVIQQAVRDACDWYIHGLSPVRVAVNVSPAQLRQRDFVERVVKAASPLAAHAGGLDIEITESMLVQDLQLSIRKLSQLKEAHIGVAIDDFGTGYSSLCLLGSLPIDTLKIDRSFVQRLIDAPTGKALISTIVALGQAFHIRTIAEGVETAEQLGILRDLRCDQAQGFLIGRPTPASKVAEVMARLASGVRAEEVYTGTPQPNEHYTGQFRRN